MRRSIIYTGIIYGRASSCEKYRMKQELVRGGKYYFTRTRAHSAPWNSCDSTAPQGAKDEFYAVNAQQ